jgi:hypothetical protein
MLLRFHLHQVMPEALQHHAVFRYVVGVQVAAIVEGDAGGPLASAPRSRPDLTVDRAAAGRCW